MLISDGKLIKAELKRSKHGEAWLYKELEKRELCIKDVFIASLSADGELYIQRK